MSRSRVSSGRSETSAPPGHPYHHGDLRRALMDAALDDIAIRGAANLSLRRLAKASGVSHAAPAHHFRDKRGVFTAIATEAFELLHDSQRRTGDGLAAEDTLLPLAVNYIHFAIEHPSHFEVMWRPDLYDPDDPDLAVAKMQVFEVFYRSVAHAVGELPVDEFDEAVAAAWSTVHGFATLWQSGNLVGIVGDDPDLAIARAARGLVAIAQVTAAQLRSPGSPNRIGGRSSPM
jgi:AcrR family transcriptional regulator